MSTLKVDKIEGVTDVNIVEIPIGITGKYLKDLTDGGYDVDLKPADIITKSPWVDARAYGTLGTQAAITAALADIGADERTLYLAPGTWSITTNLVTLTNVNLKFERGAVLAIATGTTFTINGSLDAGLYQIFSCTGTGAVEFGAGSVNRVYPEWWGTTGDGAADDVVPIQAALTAGAGKSCYFNSRTYKIMDDLNVPPYTTVEGAGDSSIIWQADTDHRGLNVDNYVTIKNIQLKGNQDQGSWVLKQHVAIASYYIYAQGLGVPGAVDPTAKGSNITVTNCYINGWFTGLWLWKNNNISNNRIISNVSEGMLISQGGNNITNNLVSNCFSWGIDFGGVNNNILSNTITTVGKASMPAPYQYDGGGICINAQSELGGTMENTIVSGNTIDDTGECTAVYIGTVGTATIDGLSIIGNIIRNYGRNAITTNDVRNSLTNLNISNNIISDCIVAGGLGIGVNISSSYGATISDFVISGNNVSNIIDVGASIYNCSDGVIAENNLIDTGVGIVLGGTLSNLNINGNALGTTALVEDSPTMSKVIIKGNLNYSSANTLMSAFTIAPATAAGKMKSTTTGVYAIGTQFASMAPADNLWDLTGLTTGVGEFCWVALCVDNAGTCTVVKGDVAALLAVAKIPWVPCTKIVVGLVGLPESYAGGAIVANYFDTLGVMQPW